MGPRTDRTETADRLLDAAPRAWTATSPAAALGGLTVSRVAGAAGVTRATFYSYWPTVDAYVAELLERLALPRGTAGPTPLAPSMLGLGAGLPGVAEMVAEECERNLDRVASDPELGIRLGFLSRADDPEVSAALRRRYRRIDDDARQHYGPIRASWGRETRPSLTTEQVHAVYTAVTEGLALRRLVDPDLVTPGLCGQVVLALTMFLTRRLDDRRDLEDVLATADSWPAVGFRLRAEVDRPEALVPRLDPTTTRRVTKEARRLLGSLGWHEVGLADIASALGLPEEALLGAFGSKAGLGMAVFMLSLHERFSAMRRTGDPAADLRRMVALGADELHRAPDVTVNVAQVLLGSSAVPAAGTIDWDPTSHLEQQIRLTQDAGQMRADLDARAFAETISRAVLLEALPRVPVPTAGQSTVELLLLGAGLPPDSRPTPAPTTPADPDQEWIAGPAADAFPG